MKASIKSTRQDWLQLGLDLLTAEGPGALTIERLCQGMQKTKGSFYHHFGDRDVYVEALLEHWEQAHTLQPMAVSQAGDARERLQMLYRTVSLLPAGPEVALRAWARSDARVAASVARVDTTRLAYLDELHAVTQPPQGHLIAVIEYALLVGLQHLEGQLPRSGWDEIFRYLQSRMLGTGGFYDPPNDSGD